MPLPPFDEPEPDLCVVRGLAGDYRERHPNHGDVLVVIEVAGSSLACDQKMKQRLYAASKVPLYIIVNLQDDTIIAYSQPVPAEQKYDQQVQFRRGEIMELSLSELGQVSLSVDEVF